ncbi:hypothetical protein EVAR_67433_1 [Eumeta japonica]|uniref:Uncharacterized protein n=1 Tax=Eumeta variegata TaxID=151549 RepID=A0A4C1ZZD7_EUMVA|nr:hypothetical protein EVAR_67433_1 [Eumeta japonica]
MCHFEASPRAIKVGTGAGAPAGVELLRGQKKKEKSLLTSFDVRTSWRSASLEQPGEFKYFSRFWTLELKQKDCGSVCLSGGVATAVHDHSQPLRSHQCIDSFLGRNGMSATGILTHWTECNCGSCYVSSVFCESVVSHWSS